MKIPHLTRNGSFRPQMQAAIATLIEYAHPEFSERWNTIEPIKREDVAQYIRNSLCRMSDGEKQLS